MTALRVPLPDLDQPAFLLGHGHIAGALFAAGFKAWRISDDLGYDFATAQGPPLHAAPGQWVIIGPSGIEVALEPPDDAPAGAA